MSWLHLQGSPRGGTGDVARGSGADPSAGVLRNGPTWPFGDLVLRMLPCGIGELHVGVKPQHSQKVLRVQLELDCPSCVRFSGMQEACHSHRVPGVSRLPKGRGEGDHPHSDQVTAMNARLSLSPNSFDSQEERAPPSRPGAAE